MSDVFRCKKDDNTLDTVPVGPYEIVPQSDGLISVSSGPGASTI